MRALPAACLPPSATVRVGFSGGLDSTVLLHWLKHALPAGTALHAIHVHHGLQADADAWEAHCRALCADWGIPLQVEHVRIADRNRNLEQQAREARHAAFKRHLQPGDTLALAHHGDDVAETLLLRLMRGAGTEALGNMAERENRANHHLWRPLLDFARADLLAYAQAHALSWVEDASNGDTGPDRNFLRQRVLPLLESRFGNVRARLSHSAALLREDAALLRPLVEDALAICRSEAGLSLSRLRALAPPLQAHVLRAWLSDAGHASPGAEALREFLHQLAEHTPDDDTRLDGPGYQIALWAGDVHLRVDGSDADGAEFDRLWDGRTPLRLPRSGELAWQGDAPFPVRVRYRHGGERIRLPGRDLHHAVKKLLSERIPPWQRAVLPFVYNGDGELLAVGDVLVSAVLDDLSRRRGIRLRWHPAASPT